VATGGASGTGGTAINASVQAQPSTIAFGVTHVQPSHSAGRPDSFPAVAKRFSGTQVALNPTTGEQPVAGARTSSSGSDRAVSRCRPPAEVMFRKEGRS
jgi:hypothetical protein